MGMTSLIEIHSRCEKVRKKIIQSFEFQSSGSLAIQSVFFLSWVNLKMNGEHDFFEELDFISLLGSKLSLYPFIGRSKRKLFFYYLIYFLVFFTSLQLIFTLCITGFSDWMEIIDMAPNIGASLMSSIKYIKMHRHREFYNHLFNHFKTEMWELIPDRLPENAMIFNKYTNISKKINQFLFYCSLTVIVIIVSFPWILMTYEKNVLGMELNYLYPFDAWYPFDKIKWYYVAYIWESIMTTIVICIYGYADILHVSYVVYICMELKLLGNLLKFLIGPKDIHSINKQKNLKKIHGNIKKNLRFIVKRHVFLSRQISVKYNIIFYQ